MLRAACIAAAVGGCAVMLLMLCIICANIAIRPFGGSIRGAQEISGYLCALGVGLCMPAAQLAGSHIKAGLWADKLPAFLQKLIESALNAACAATLALVAAELYSIGEMTLFMGEYIDGFGFSYFTMAVGFAFGIAMHSVLFLLNVFSAFIPEKGAAA